MLINEFERQRQRFQHMVFASLAVVSIFITLASFLLFSTQLSFAIDLHYVVTLFALIPMSLVALMLSIVFRRINAQLFKEAEGLRSLLEASPIGIFSLDKDGIINAFNTSMTQIWDVEAKEMNGINVFGRLQYQNDLVDKLLRVGLEGKQFEEEVQVTHAGKSRWHWYRGIPIVSQRGKIDYLLVLVQDITHRKEMQLELATYASRLEEGLQEQLRKLQERTEELEHLNADSEKTKRALLNVLEDTRQLEYRLREEHDRLQSIVSSMGEGVVVTDEKGKITFLNMAAQNLLELSPQEALKSSIFDVIQPLVGTRKESPAVSVFQKSMKNRSIERVSLRDDYYWKTRSGRVFPVSLVVAPLLSDEVRGSVIVFRDITDDKQMDDAKTNFISIASHQLRTPLTAIRWLTELLTKEGKGKLEPQLEMYADDILQSARRMIVLVNSLLNVSRIEAGRLRVSTRLIQFETVVQSVIDELSMAARASHCDVLFRKPAKPLPKIPLDVGLIRQVVQNLLTNAIRYSRPNSCEILIELAKEDKHLLLKVKDTGIGIPKEAQERIFEKFYRASNAVKKQTDGTGLGMYISKLIVEMAGGRIWFESVEDKGTIFYVSLPLRGMQEREGEVALIDDEDKMK